MLRTAVLVAMVVAACGRDHGSPRSRPMPKIDGSPALRGGGAARSPRAANYKIEARLDPMRHLITASETLTWTNTSASEVDTLPLHLYLNAFKNEQSLLMRTSQGLLRQAHATENSWGFVDIASVHVAGIDLTAKLHPPANAHAHRARFT